ncbi:ArgS-related anticodon-binding protein NrtL [Streptomyces sp. NPDC047081]|uniref:ArgS-related anticodon-binding protein NrtL n=1 Tax=Streptomyces sp. NPDC047081 TaxID=3154706 RepID=UPI003405B617
MTPVELSHTVLRAVRRAVDEGELSVAVPVRAVVAPPGPGGCGDYATNIALQLARPAGRAPRDVAEILRQHLAAADGIADVTLTGPGFLNISLGEDVVSAEAALVTDILRAGAAYGHSDVLAGETVELRIPYDDVRADVLADALSRIIASQGGRAEVDHREPVNLRPVPAPEDPAPLGPDAARWALLHPAAHDRPRITAEHLVQRESNPLFRVRYAHARTRALSRNAADLGFSSEPGDPRDPEAIDARHLEPGGSPHAEAVDASHRAPNSTPRPEARGPRPPEPADIRHLEPSRIPHPEPLDASPPKSGGPRRPQPAAPRHPDVTPLVASRHPDVTPLITSRHPDITSLVTPLVTALADHPRILTTAATRRSPDRLTRQLVTVADAVLALLPTVLPRGDEKPSAAHRARLALAEAAGTVLAGGLSLLGIDAPDHL